jgi:hypothetical protein
MSDVEVIPPEGKTSFSGIPESQFIDDVALYMKVINPVWLRLPYASAVLWIRIYWGQILILHFRLNTQQDPDPGFSWPKIVKKITSEKNLVIHKLQFTYPQASLKDVQDTGEAFSSQKRTYSTSKH